VEGLEVALASLMTAVEIRQDPTAGLVLKEHLMAMAGVKRFLPFQPDNPAQMLTRRRHRGDDPTHAMRF
jgi:hypothetical protein